MKAERLEASEAKEPTTSPKRNGRTQPAVWRDELIIDLLWRLGRERPLTIEERTVLAKAEHRQRVRQPSKHEVWRWTAEEDRKLRRLIRKRERNGRPKAFQPNDEVRDLAKSMSRTYMAVHRRMERLRKQMKPTNGGGV